MLRDLTEQQRKEMIERLQIQHSLSRQQLFELTKRIQFARYVNYPTYIDPLLLTLPTKEMEKQ